MVMRFVSIPQYPKDTEQPQNAAAMAGAWLEVGYRDGKPPKIPIS